MDLVAPWRIDDARHPDAVAVARRRIAEVDDRVRAWITPVPSGPAGDGPLAGVPVGVKDIVDVLGVPTRCGARARADAPPATADAAIVRLLRAAGAVVVGKTVTTEFAYFDPGPTRNPHDPTRTPGGSSSGSAAAVAAGMVPLAVGSQTAGSVVRPASFCGVAGLAVARGVLPYDGVAPLAPSFDTLGLFAATVADLAVARAALDGRTPAPETADPLRLLVWDGTAVAAVSPEMRVAHATAVDRLRAAGATVNVFDVDLRVAVADHRTVMAAEAAVAVPELPGLSDELVALLDQGRAVAAGDLAAARARSAATRETVLARLADADAVLAPGALGAAPPIEGGTGDPTLSRPWHALGLPALAVPGLAVPGTGVSDPGVSDPGAAGLPLGLQLIGHPAREDALLAAGRRLEALLAS